MFLNKNLPGGSIEFWQGNTMYNPSRQVNPERFQEVHFRRTSNVKYISQVVNRVERELYRMRENTREQKKPFLFSDSRLGHFAIACSESIQNAILHDPHDKLRMIEVSIWCDPEALILVGVTDSLGPIAFQEWNLTVDQGETYLGENKRGLFVMTAFADRVLYFPDDRGSGKDLMLMLEPDL